MTSLDSNVDNNKQITQFQQSRNPSHSTTIKSPMNLQHKSLQYNKSRGERNYAQLVSQSVQSSTNLRSLENRDFNNAGMGVVVRADSTSNIKQIILNKERNCKTSSPTHHFITHESRLRKKSREMIQKKRESFADLIVILGLKYNEFVETKRVTPQVVDSYPDLNIKEVAKEHNYVDNLIWICFPEGYRVQAYEKRNEGELCQMKIFHFIITNQDGIKKYITSILFKELFLSEKLGSFIVPKSICVVSSKPIFGLQKQLLTLIFQKVILPYNSASIQAQSQNPANYIWYLNDQNEENIKKNPDLYIQKRIEFYLSIFFNHIYYNEDVDNDIQIEEITAKMTPSHYGPDGTKRKRSTKKIVESFFRYRNTKTYGFTLENYSFELLLQSLKPEKIIFLVTALLLERKVVLIKDNFGDIAVIMESLVSLLNPLKWNFVFITYLTKKLVECLEAPFPYIIGVSRKIWEDDCVIREFPDDIIIFDVDRQEKLNLIREELPPLPQPQANVLERSLKELLDMKERFTEILQHNTNEELSQEKINEYYWAYAQLRVKQSFFNFFMLTINNYIGYFKNLDEDGDLSPSKKDKKFYDKLSSIDVFDFDNYLDQFEGLNKEFMEKFVRTQSFNNFIEETYKNVSPKTPIGFFKTNFEVMLEHSFKRLKREQNKLIDLTLYNYSNPVKFNLKSMLRQYKRQLLQKHGDKIKQILEEEGDINSLDNDDRIDLLQRQDLIEKLLLLEVEGNSKKQLSILNNITQDLVTEMPGIQYEAISNYEHMKSQRSDQSQDRRVLNKTGLNGVNSAAFEFQQRAHNESQQHSDTKSRNQTYIIQSRSGEAIRNVSVNMSMQSKPRGGLIYKNYLSMADNKNLAMLSQEEEILVNQSLQNLTTLTMKNALMTQEFEAKLLQQISGTMTTKNTHEIAQKLLRQRVNSVNTNNLKSTFSLNKTVVVGSNQQLQRPNTQVQKAPHKSKTSKIDSINGLKSTLNQSQNFQKALTSSAGFKAIDKQRYTSSPKIMNPTQKAQNLSHSAFISDTVPKNYQQQQQSVLKEALNRKIMHERFKHGLQLKYDEQDNSKILLGQSGIFSPGQQKEKIIDTSLQGKDWKHVPKTNIDLMNPKKQKISRNEERKLAQKRGFLGFESHDSFYQFYSPKEELSKLAKMQNIQKQLYRNNNQLQESKDLSFSHFLSQNYNSNGSEDDRNLQSSNMNSNNNNKIIFQKRSPINNDQFVLIANDPLSTTINFQHNFIQQKPQLQQSPNTEMSSTIKKGRQNFIRDSIDEEFCVINQSPLLESNNSTNNPSNFLVPGHPQIVKNVFQLKSNQDTTLIDGNDSSQKDSNISNNSLKPMMITVDTHHSQQLSQSNVEDLECNETRPLKLEDTQGTNGGNQQFQMKHQKIRQSESPSQNFQSRSNLSFKYFANTVKDGKDKQNNTTQVIQSKKGYKQMNSSNKSPTHNNISKISQNAKTFSQASKEVQNSKQTQQTSTFDGSQRTDFKPATLARKRSSPAINEKTPQQLHHQHSSNLKTSNSKGFQMTKNSSTKQQIQQQSSYFKQRPVAHHQKSNKSSLMAQATIQIDLEKKEKLREQAPRIATEKDLADLRISPIPNLNHILSQQQSEQDGSNTLSNNSAPLSQQQQHSSILVAQQQKGVSSVSNFQSIQSEKSLNGRAQDTQTLFQSMTQANEQDIFDKAQLTIGRQASGQSANNKSHHGGKLKNKLGNNHQHLMLTKSQRSSSIKQDDMKSRISQLSLNSGQRPSQISSIAELQRQEKDLDLVNTGSRQSDQLSNEAPNSISISILKSSPKLMAKQLSHISNSNLQSSQNNFLIQEGCQIPSIMASQDLQNMQSLLNKLKQELPQNNNHNTAPSNVSTVKIDLHKPNKLVFSPKGAVEKEVRKQNSKKQLTLDRASSIEQIRQIKKSPNNLLLNDTQQTPNILTAKDKQFSSMHVEHKKTVKSPQPSSQVLSSNPYLKSLQSQEFQLKEKAKKKYQQVYNSLHQSMDPIISLQKESKSSIINHNSNNQLSKSNINFMSVTSNNSSQKLLKMDFQEKERVIQDQQYFTNQSQRNNKSQQHSHITQSCKSTKNLYSQINKEKLLDVINGVNDTLHKIEISKKYSKSKNILEDALTSKSNSNSSRQPSPKSNSLIQKNNSKMFKTTNGGSNEQQNQMVPTVRIMNNEYPIKKISFHNERNSKIQQQEGSENLDLVIIDFPRQIEEGYIRKDQNMYTKSLINDRSSKIIALDVERLMSDKPQTRKMESVIGKSKNSIISSSSHSHYQTTLARGRSQKSYLDSSSQPLIELRYISNNQRPSDIQKQNFQASINDTKKLHHNRNQMKTPTLDHQSNITSNNVVSSRHSHALDKMPNEFSNIVMKQQKKRQLRHGLTTCFAATTKDSIQYVRRDMNNDAFCKINSHRGDIDNDPHTPKSHGSLRSIEKRGKKKRNVKHQYQGPNDINFDGFVVNMIQSSDQHNDVVEGLVLRKKQSKYTPLRMHSASVDDRDFASPLQLESAPLQSKRRQDLENNNEVLMPSQIRKEKITSNNHNENMRYEVLFDDADLKDTEDKFTSRDINFNRLKHFINE